MKRTQATIKDIALSLNIAPSTVSRALKDHYSISQKTKDAVMKLAKELNYRPNTIALSLLNKRTNVIGVLIPEVVQPFYSSAISGIEKEAISKGFRVIFCQSHESTKLEIEALQALENSRVDGIIICHASENKDFSHIRNAKEMGIPLVLLDRAIDGLNVSKVVANDEQGAFTITKHLILGGFSRIAHIAGPTQLSITKNRLKGYLDALEHYKMPIDKQLIKTSNLKPKDVERQVESLLKLPNPPDAIFCVNDPTAITASQFLKERGLNIPEDIAVAGFDNQPITAYTEPSITTIIQPSYEMGSTAARLLLKEIMNPDEGIAPETKIMETRLITRKSTVRKHKAFAS